ncbi:TOBE-like domain-containing protein, partial [Bacillus sp. SS-TM]
KETRSTEAKTKRAGRTNEASASSGETYVRPHDLSISRTKQSIDAIPAKVSYSHAVGNIVYVELKRDGTDEYLEAEITKEQFKQLNIQAGDFVYVQPKEVKVFIPEDFVI